MKRHIYLEDIPLDEAKAVFTTTLEQHGLWQPLESETVPLHEASGRITAVSVWAKRSSPHYHASAMDGYALRATDSVGATETNPLTFTLIDNEAHAATVSRPAQAVNTGQPLPSWANCVVMIEHTQPIPNATAPTAISIQAALPPWRHVRPMGEDIIATSLVLPANHKLRPFDLGAIAGAGHATVTVYKQPRVAILPTGSELVPVEEATTLTAGQIIEYNSIVLAAQVAAWGGIPTRWPIVPDEPEAIKTAVSQAAQEHDLVLVNAGSSAGSKDYTAHVVQALGQLLVHGVAIRPGHPVILGLLNRADDSTLPVLGIPGYPVSAALTGEIFVEPLLAHWQGQQAYQPPTITAHLTRKVNSHTGDDDYVRVAVGKVDDKVMATPISRGAGVITSLVRADGLLRVPRFSEGIQAGTAVTVHLYRSLHEIARTIVAIGSHDLSLDLLAQALAEGGHLTKGGHLTGKGGYRLTSANVGSLGGLIALRRGEAHIAGSHLLDPDTGIYNDSYIRQYLPKTPVTVITFVSREQGWILPKGNPKGIHTWADVAQSGIEFVNRQRGAGTRVLLDYELEQRGIATSAIAGYDRETYTHLAVAAAVASGTADVGLGICAAARALDLDFVPLAQEQYELIIPQTVYEGNKTLAPLLTHLHSDVFKTAVGALPGYDASQMGQRRTIIP